MTEELPEFEKRPYHQVMPYITRIFSYPGQSSSHLVKLIPYEDGHYRAVFKSTYFSIKPGETDPSKSQWSTLKKKMKRHDRRVFVFKKSGEVDCAEIDTAKANPDFRCYYIDFGFFAH